MPSPAQDTTAEVATQSHKDKFAKLTRSDVGVILKLRRDGLTQAAIAQRLGCSQGTVAKWLSQFTDTTDTAKEFLQASAFRMAKNIVAKGLARDHVQVLNGLGVLQEQSSQGLTLVINGLTLHGTGRGEGAGEVVEGEALSPLQITEAGEGAQNP
jgi:transcriptional regulator with XRE-family HTH domain